MSLFFFLFFLSLEKVSKSTHSFTVYETNLFSFFLSFSEYIYTYNIQYLGRVEGKIVLSCTYLFEGFTLQVPFFYGQVTSPSESAGLAFLLTTVQRFCSMLFLHGNSPGAGCRPMSLFVDFCPQTQNPFLNFLWWKGTIFRR